MLRVVRPLKINKPSYLGFFNHHQMTFDIESCLLITKTKNPSCNLGSILDSNYNLKFLWRCFHGQTTFSIKYRLTGVGKKTRHGSCLALRVVRRVQGNKTRKTNSNMSLGLEWQWPSN
jgi:hypothetical protein